VSRITNRLANGHCKAERDEGGDLVEISDKSIPTQKNDGDEGSHGGKIERE